MASQSSYSPGPGSERTLRLYGCFLISGGCDVLHDMKEGQPLLLDRVSLSTFTLAVRSLNGAPFAYVNPYDAAWITARIDAGEIWLARLKTGCSGVPVIVPSTITVWRDGINVKDEEIAANGPIETPVFRKFKPTVKENA